MLLSVLWYLSTQGWTWKPKALNISHHRPKTRGKYGPSFRSVGTSRKPAATKQQEDVSPRDPNCNQLRPGSVSRGDLKVSLDGSLSQPDANEYHWYEDDDLSETVEPSEQQPAVNHNLLSSKETNDPNYVALAQQIDSHLAHIDMEEFKSEDMHSLLLEETPATNHVQATTCETSFSQDDCSLTDGSLCKSGPLFSPQRAANHVEFSTDSLNSDKEEWVDEAEKEARHLLLTVDCKTNMTNYTLAWSSGTDIDYNEPGSSSSGSDHSHWSSSGGGCGMRTVSRYAPPIPPWPTRPGVSCSTWPRIDRTVNAAPSFPIVHNLQTLPASPFKKGVNTKECTNQSNNSSQQNQSAKNLFNLGNTRPVDADNGNDESASKDSRCPEKLKAESEAAAASETLSLLQIYMRQKSTSAAKSPRTSDPNEVIACGGGEGWIEDYPSSVDGKISSDSESSSSFTENKDARSMTLTDASDIEQTSLQIDAQPFNCSHKLLASCGTASSLDKLIAKIKPFEIGLSPNSIDEHWNGQSHGKRDEKSCQTAPVSSKDESTLTDPPASPAVYLIFPSYSMPDLSFLRKSQYQWIDQTLLAPQDFSEPAKLAHEKEAMRKLDEILKKDLSHVKDWDSLNVLLPKEISEAVHSTARKRPTANSSKQQRPKSCDAGVLLREQKNQRSQRSSGYRGSSTITWTESGFTLPTVPQSPPSPNPPCGEIPPPLPKRTASLPTPPCKSSAPTPKEVEEPKTKRPIVPKNPCFQEKVLSHAAVNKPKNLSLPKQYSEYGEPCDFTPNLRKTVSFGERLCSGLTDKKLKTRPLSASNWEPEYGSCDSPNSQDNAMCNMDKMKSLVQEASVAAAQLCRLMHQSIVNEEDEDSSLLMKHISRTITGKLSPALYELLSDGLLATVSTFFGQVTNSVWRVVEASVKKGPTLPWVEELVFCLNNEESLPEGPVRFGVFVAELVNMGALDWWLDNLACKEAIIRRHYASQGFLYLCHTTARALMQDLKTALKPLAALPLDCSIPWNAEVPWKSKSSKVTPTKTSPTKTSPTKTTPTKTTPTKTPPARVNGKLQRPLSCVESPSKSPVNKAGYRRAQSQQQMTVHQSNASNVVTDKGEPFSSLKNKWEKLSSQRKQHSDPAPLRGQQLNNATQSPVKSRIPRPVSRVLK